MDFQKLYLSADGRLNRQPFWIGILILGVVNIVIAFGLLAVLFAGGSTIGSIVGFIISLAFMYPIYCLLKKRLQDRDDSGKILIPYFGIIIASSIIGILMGPTNVDDPAATLAQMGSPLGIVNLILSVIGAAIGIYLLVVAGFLKGTEGPNQYGPDPLG